MNIETAIRVGDVLRFGDLFAENADKVGELLAIASEARYPVICKFLQAYQRRGDAADAGDYSAARGKGQEKSRKKRTYIKLEEDTEEGDAELTKQIEAQRERRKHIVRRYASFVRTLKLVAAATAALCFLLAVLDVLIR